MWGQRKHTASLKHALDALKKAWSMTVKGKSVWNRKNQFCKLRVPSLKSSLMISKMDSQSTKLWQVIASICWKWGKIIAISQLQSLSTRMKPAASATGKAKQGSSDPNSLWSKARSYWTLRLLVRFGAERLENLLLCDDYTKVALFSLDQIAWRDEKHRHLQALSVKGWKAQT